MIPPRSNSELVCVNFSSDFFNTGWCFFFMIKASLSGLFLFHRSSHWDVSVRKIFYCTQTALALEANPVLFAHLHEVPSSKPHQMKCLSAHSWLFISFHNSFRPRKSRVRTTSSVNPSDFAISRFVYPIAKRRSGSRYIGFIWPISSVRRSMLSVLTAASSGTGAASGSFGTSSSNSSR